jgi:hypothetical protein
LSQIEVWGTGRPLKGFTEDAVLTSARKLFPTTKAQHIARFIAGKRFIITRVNGEAAAQKLIDGLAKSGIQADTAGPPPSLSAVEASEVVADDEEALMLMGELEDPAGSPAAPAPAAAKPSSMRWKLIAAVVCVPLLIAIAAAAVIWQRQDAHDAATQARIEATTRASVSAKFQAEADARRQAEEDAAAKVKATAEEAQRLAKQDAAIAEINNAYADGNYPSVIALSERFDGMYGADARVAKLEQNATFNLKEGARRGNFAAILNAPIKGSVRYEALRQWALQVQERAKPQQ